MRVASLAPIGAVALALLTGACVHPNPGSFAAAERDPWEKTNRKIYALNKSADKYVLKPVAQGYIAVVPAPLRKGVRNAYNNTQEPLSFVNAVLQGKVSQAFRTLDRLVINSTLGIGGLVDVATDMGRPEQSEDFGQTFAWWGIPSGPFVMVPFFGPQTLLDTAGIPADIFLDPVPVAQKAFANIGFWASSALFVTRATITRAYLLESGGDVFLETSLDEYATVRSAYLQRRWSEIWDGNPPEPAEEDYPLDEAPLDAAPAETPATPAPAAAPSIPTSPVAAAEPVDAAAAPIEAVPEPVAAAPLEAAPEPVAAAPLPAPGAPGTGE